MKRVIFFIFSSFLVVNIYGQSESSHIAKKNTIGVHVNTFSYMRNSETFDSNPITSSFGLGIDYSRELSNRWSFCSGLEQRIFFNTNDLRCNDFIIQVKSSYGITGIPAVFKYNFSNLVYIKTGPHFNFYGYAQSNIYNAYKSIGLLLSWQLSAGLEHVFDNGIMLSLSPDIRWYPHIAKLRFSLDNYFRPGFILSVNLGIGYKF